MQIYHLSDADIHHVCKTTEQFLDANKTEHMKSLRLRMMLEEMLLNYQMRFGEEKKFSLETRKMFGRVRVVVSLTGESFDPFITEDDEDQAVLQYALPYYSDSWGYQRMRLVWRWRLM